MNSICRIEEFLRTYEHNCTLENNGPALAQFADSFQVGGPQGTMLLERKVFAAMMPKRRQMVEEMGCGPAELVSIETKLLDDRYALACTRWRFPVGSAGEPVYTQSSFLIEDVSGTLQIVLYLSHDDLPGILAKRKAGMRAEEA